MWMGGLALHPRATASPTSPPPAPSSTLESQISMKILSPSDFSSRNKEEGWQTCEFGGGYELH